MNIKLSLQEIVALSDDELLERFKFSLLSSTDTLEYKNLEYEMRNRLKWARNLRIIQQEQTKKRIIKRLGGRK